jgi:hypothetical protein
LNYIEYIVFSHFFPYNKSIKRRINLKIVQVISKNITKYRMSKQGLYDQLTFEYGSQMTVDEANNAINRIDPLVNWNNLAILSAKSYRETGNLTGQALIDQLTSEYGSRFPPEQAQYGVLHIDDEVKSSAI